jgi:hypothetical protein
MGMGVGACVRMFRAALFAGFPLAALVRRIVDRPRLEAFKKRLAKQQARVRRRNAEEGVSLYH